jgi:hypothetical protein
MLGFVAAGAWITDIDSSAAQAKKPAADNPQKKAAGKDQSPRTVNGQPDISGIWGSGWAGAWTVNLEPGDYLRKIGMPRIPPGIQSNSGDVPMPLKRPPKAAVIDPPTGILPYQPWALERRNSVMKDFPNPQPWQIDTQTRGWPSGVPRENHYSSVDGSYGGPIQILQPPGYVIFLYETHHEFRIVPLDGRPQPGKDIKLWEGSSRGRWEGNTLVIEVTNNNDSPRLTVIGDFHSDEMKVTERWTRTDKDTLEYTATIDDPKVFTRPWTVATTYKPALKDIELMEYAGVEGDKSAGIATEEAIKRGAGAAK